MIQLTGSLQMNKIVKINDITYNIQVVLDYIVEKELVVEDNIKLQ